MPTQTTFDAPQNVAETVRDLMLDGAPVRPMALPDLTGDIDATDLHESYGAPSIVAAPAGTTLRDLTADLRRHAEAIKPVRRRGTDTLTRLESLVAWASRFTGPNAALFAQADDAAPSLTCVANWHGAGAAQPDGKPDPAAQFGDHRAEYSFPVSPEWRTWNAASGDMMSKDEFGELIEANAKDFLDPTPALLGNGKPEAEWEKRMTEVAGRLDGRFARYGQLRDLSRAFAVHESSRLVATSNRDTGEMAIQFESEHRDAAGEKVTLPNLFILAIPVFDGGALYRIPVRWRYRKLGNELRFVLSLYEPEVAFRAAFDEAVAAAAGETGLPVFYGATKGVA